MAILDAKNLATIQLVAKQLIDEALEQNLPFSNLESRQRYALAVLTWALLINLKDITGDETLTRSVIDTSNYLQGDAFAHLDYCHLLKQTAPSFTFEAPQNTLSLHTLEDIIQYTTFALHEYAERQITVPDDYVPALEHLGYSPPTRRYRPDAPTLWDLLPLPTNSVRRQPLESELLALLQQGDSLQQTLIALLLWVNSRDQAVNLNVIDVLTKIRGILLGIYSDHTKNFTLNSVDAQIHIYLESIIMDLDLVRPELFRRKYVIDPTKSMSVANQTLVFTRAWANGDVRSADGLNLETMFWDEFRKLDFLLEHQVYPDLVFELQFELVMVGAMMVHDLSPGSAVSDVQAVAAQQLNVPVLWHWKEFQSLGCSGTPIFMNASSFLFLVQLIRIVQLSGTFIPVDEKKVALVAARKLAGHVLACCERLNIRLPQHSLIRDYLSKLGYLSSIPIKKDDYFLLEEEAAAIIFRVSSFMGQLGVRMREESALTEVLERTNTSPVDLTTTDDVEQPHMQQARSFLCGKRVVLIGGEIQLDRQQKLIDTFDLLSLDWISASEYTHGTHAAHRIDGKADLLLIAIRWMGHAHSTLKDVARAAGIPVVYLPAGLGLHTVAWEVCEQTGKTVKYRSAAMKA